MSAQRIGILALITVIIVVAATLTLRQRDQATRDALSGALFFPELAQRVNDVAAIEIVRGATTITVTRNGDVWSLKERNNYPANFDVVRPVVLALSQLKVVEAKTSKPDQFARLGVDDPAGEDAVGTGVTVRDVQGAVLAGVILGETRDSDDGLKKLTYVRRSGETQAWLVEGQVQLPDGVAPWLKKDMLIDILRPRIKSFSVSLSEGDRYMIARDKPEDKGFKYLPPPRTGKIRSQARLDDMAGALINVVPLDVFPEAMLPLDASKSVNNEYRTFDGITVKVTLMPRDGKWFAAFKAAADASASDAAKQEAQKISANVEGWVFEIAEAKANLMTKKNSDVLAPN